MARNRNGWDQTTSNILKEPCIAFRNRCDYTIVFPTLTIKRQYNVSLRANVRVQSKRWVTIDKKIIQ